MREGEEASSSGRLVDVFGGEADMFLFFAWPVFYIWAVTINALVVSRGRRNKINVLIVYSFLPIYTGGFRRKTGRCSDSGWNTGCEAQEPVGQGNGGKNVGRLEEGRLDNGLGFRYAVRRAVLRERLGAMRKCQRNI